MFDPDGPLRAVPYYVLFVLLIAPFLFPMRVPADAKERTVQAPYIFRSLRLEDPKPLVMRKLEADPKIRGISLSTNRFYAFLHKNSAFEMCLSSCARNPDRLCGVELTSPSGSSLQGYGGVRRFESLLVKLGNQQLGTVTKTKELTMDTQIESAQTHWTHFWTFPEFDSSYSARVGLRRHKITNPLDQEFRENIKRQGEPVIQNVEYMAVLRMRMGPTGSCLRFPSASGRKYFFRENRRYR